MQRFQFSTASPVLRAGLLLVAALFASQAGANQSADNLWRDAGEAGLARPAGEPELAVRAYRLVHLSAGTLDAMLEGVPDESITDLSRSAASLSLPLPDGRFAEFQIVETWVMAPELAARFPEIRTFVGRGIDDPTASLRLDVTPKGLHAQVLSAEGTWLVDPFRSGDAEHYIAYFKRDALRRGEPMRCEVDGTVLDGEHVTHDHASPRVSSGATLRTYRLAVAATDEYTEFHGGTVLDGMGGIVTTMNRVNGIYERELGIRMQLVPNNDLIVYTDFINDPYDNLNGGAMLGQNQTNLNNVIGSANYDIGHVVSTGGGGVASLGSVCSAGSKARGVTGLGQPVGDVFYVDFVAHEMGHQFAGNHTFNGSGGNCSGGNRNPSTAYEPGSGTSIQAYAGICSADNLQPNSDDHFHRLSLNEMLAFKTSGGGSTCGASSATGNTPPTVTTAAGFTIPQLTPFELTADGDDVDGDTITYLWEQFDLGARNATGNLVDDGARPIFRSFAPSLSPERVFPSWRFILDNANSPPQQTPLPGTSSPNFFAGEVLPSTNRSLNFRVTVRDNRVGGGGTNEASTLLTVTTAAGPFQVTAPNTAVSWAAGTTESVTWNVASTDAAPVSTANVRITLSLDGGLTWPIELAASEANDGSASVSLPANLPATNQARIRVSAVGNVFFDVSDANFSITGANTPPSLTVNGSLSTRQGSPETSGNVGQVSDTQDSAGSLLLAVDGAPPELAVAVDNDNGTVVLTAQATCEVVAPTSGNRIYPVDVTVIDSAGAMTRGSVNINVAANLTPTVGQYADTMLVGGGTAMVTPNALVADANGNLLAPSVSPSDFGGEGSISIDSDGVVSLDAGAASTGDYTIDITVQDSCGATEFRRFVATISDTLFRDGFEDP